MNALPSYFGRDGCTCQSCKTNMKPPKWSDIFVCLRSWRVGVASNKTDVQTNTCIKYVYTRAPTVDYVCTCTYMFMYICIHHNVHIFMCISLYVYIYIYKYTCTNQQHGVFKPTTSLRVIDSLTSMEHHLLNTSKYKYRQICLQTLRKYIYQESTTCFSTRNTGNKVYTNCLSTRNTGNKGYNSRWPSQ